MLRFTQSIECGARCDFAFDYAIYGSKSTRRSEKKLCEKHFLVNISYTIPSKSYDVKGKVSGELVGGNISILYSLLGSKSSIDTKRKNSIY